MDGRWRRWWPRPCAARPVFRRADGRLPLAVSLREKDLAGAELADLARELGELTRAAGADLYVNGRLDVALAAGAAGRAPAG